MPFERLHGSKPSLKFRSWMDGLHFSPLQHICTYGCYRGFPGGPVVRNPSADTGDTGLIPRWERSFGIGNSNPFQYSCLENPMNRGAWFQRFLKLPRNAPFKLGICSSNFSISALLLNPSTYKTTGCFLASFLVPSFMFFWLSQKIKSYIKYFKQRKLNLIA